MKTNIFAVIIIFLFSSNFVFAANNPLACNNIIGDLQLNKKWVKVEKIGAVRVDLVINTNNMLKLFDALKKEGFTNEYDGYDDVFFHIPWTSATDSFVEYSRLIFGVNESSEKMISWLNKSRKDFEISQFMAKDVQRMKVIHQVIKDKVEDNPNPVKWFNKRKAGEYPVSSNYPENYIGSLKHLIPQVLSKLKLEINSPLNSSDLDVFISEIKSVFPEIKLIASHSGIEQFSVADSRTGGTAPVKTYKYPTARLVFDISSLNQEKHLHLLNVIEYFHSYKVPVARIFE